MNIMKISSGASLLFGMALCVQIPCGSAQAGSLGSISGLLQSGAAQLIAIPIPGLGNLGSLSLSTLDSVPGLSMVSLPVIGSFEGIPVVGSLTVSQGLVVLESVSPFRSALPGLSQ